MGLTVLPSSLPSRGGAAASRPCASSLRLNLACIGRSTATDNAKEPKRPGSCLARESKRPGSFRAGEQASKRRRVGEDADVAVTKAISLEEKDGVNRLLLSLLPPGRSPNEVILLPDSVVRVLQENGTRCHGGGDEEIEIDVHALGEEALRVIKDRVGAYVAGRAGIVEGTKQSKEGVIKQNAARSVPSKAAARRILMKPALTSHQPRHAPMSTLARAAPTSITSLRVVPSPLVPPKAAASSGCVSEHLETDISQGLPKSTLLTASLSLPALPESSGNKKSIKELLADASEVMKKVVRRREIEKLRAAARREVEHMVRTVEFNDPYIDYKDVFK